MNYNENYHTRISAKTLKTKQYSETELSAVRQMIKRFLLDENPNTALNTNEANYLALADAINEHYKEEVLTARFIYDIYLQNSDSQKKNIRKMNAIKEFVQQHFQQKAPQMQVVRPSETERLAHKIDELQQDMKVMMSWVQQMAQSVIPSEKRNPFMLDNSGTWLLQQRA